jgi:hypothetical protein
MMIANNEFTGSQGKENWEPIFKMMFGDFWRRQKFCAAAGI